MDPITATLALKKGFKAVKKKAGATVSWMANNWIPLLLLAVLVASSAFWYNRGLSKGSERADAAWIEKYNAVVADFNKRLLEAKKNSSKVADTVDSANNKVNDDLDGIQGSLENAAKRQEQADKSKSNQIGVGQCAPKKVTLNDPLPPEFFNAWAKMNEVGATHDPYADVK